MRLESAAVAGLAVLSRTLPLLALLFSLLAAGCGRKGDVLRHPLMIRAERCRAEGEPVLAMGFYKKLLQRRPDSPLLRLKIATLCDEVLNDPIGAIYHYNIYLNMVPGSPDAPAVEGYRLMARAKLLRELKREALPKPPADTFDEQLLQIRALKKENQRINRSLQELTKQNRALQSYISSLRNYYERDRAVREQHTEELYTVRSGDTLSGIAAARGVPLRSLMQANGLSGSSVLRAGQVLRIPPR